MLVLILTACTNTQTAPIYCNDWDQENIEQGGIYIRGELLVAFNEEVTQQQAEEVLASYMQIEIDHSSGNRPIYVIKVPEGKELEWICTLKEEETIKNVELSYEDELES